MTSGDDNRSTVQGVVAAVYERWWDGSSTGWDQLLAPDSVVLGPGADEVYLGRDGTSGSARPGEPATERPAPAPDIGTVRVGISPAGQSGWFWGFARSPHGSTGSSAQLRVSGSVSRGADGRWTVCHMFVSEAIGNERLGEYQLLAPTLTLLPQRVRPGAENLVPLLHANLGIERLDTLPRRDDIVVIGTDPAELFQGAQAYLDAFAPMRVQLEELQSTLRVDVVGGIDAALTPDAQTGYLATHLSSTVAGKRLPTLRVSWVFSRLAGNQFRLVCDHHAFPTPHPPLAPSDPKATSAG